MIRYVAERLVLALDERPVLRGLTLGLLLRFEEPQGRLGARHDPPDAPPPPVRVVGEGQPRDAG